MILNLYKPIGLTSFGVVRIVRSITRFKKVGHGGTLDPFAEGVLILGTGNDTKSLGEITNSDKSYRGTIKLGATTNTLDLDGVITKEKKIPKLSSLKIKNVFQSFTGPRLQTPPMFSAKKIGGVKLYELARKNIKVKRQPSHITINKLNLEDFSDSMITFSVTCSKGTYIRVLGKEIAEKLGTVGYLNSLVRTRVGDYYLKDSKTIKQFRTSWKSYAH